MKKVLCISTENKKWFEQCGFPFKVWKIYKVELEDMSDNSYLIRKESGNSFWVKKDNFIDMKMVWSAIVFFFILLFAMTGESIVDYILKTLFGL